MTRFPSMTRREMLQLAMTGAGAASLSGWMGPLARQVAAQTAQGGARPKSCILLWMDGGPSHTDSFDPKPDAPDFIRGGYDSIATSVPGIRVCEKLPKVAALMQHAAILRGMSTEEPDHARARIHLHTGFRPGAGGLTYPTLGSIISAELPRPDSLLPNFVVTGTPQAKSDFLSDAGYRGPQHQPLAVSDVTRGVENLEAILPTAEFDTRTGILQELERNFSRTHRSPAAQGHSSTLDRALQLMRSNANRAFDISLESNRTRDLYGTHRFGQGCLLARRLVEAGVGCVEVYLSNWDSHDRRTADGVRTLLTQVDDGISALVRDLDQRGMLHDTLILWMGEFGRTPRVNANGGRDHYARAWSTVLFGGSAKGGQAVGRTDAQASAVTERPIAVIDFMATVCRLLGIDYTRRINTAGGRPIRIVDDKGEKLITEVL